jgi:hypothetical protein
MGKPFKPQTSRFGSLMAEHPRLDDLVWLANAAADDADRVLQRYALDGRVKQTLHKRQRRCLAPVGTLCSKVFGAADSYVSARRVGDHQVPTVVDDVEHITLVVWPRRICRQQIAGHCVVPALEKSVAHST